MLDLETSCNPSLSQQAVQEDDAENNPRDDDSLIVVEIDSGMFHCSRDGFFASMVT